MTGIIGIKLASGEEVIGTFNDKSVPDQKLVLDKPLTLGLVRGQNGKITPQFAPVVLGANDLQTMSFNWNSLSVLPFEVSSEVEKAYRQNTSPLDLSAVKI